MAPLQLDLGILIILKGCHNCQLSIVNSVKPLNNNLPLRRVGPMAAVYENKYTIPESGLSTHFPVRRTLAFAGGTCYNRFIYF